MTPAHMRAARAALNWSQARLAQEASINPNTVAYWERCEVIEVTGAVSKMLAAMQRHGVRIEGDTLVLPSRQAVNNC